MNFSVWRSKIIGRRLKTTVFGIAIACLVMGCAPRPGADLLYPVERAPRFTPKVEMLVATTRDIGDPSNPFALATGRSPVLNYGTHTISIPTKHVPGQIEWPDQDPPDPAYHFMTTDRSLLERNAFMATLRQKAATRDKGRVLVFVHGYNMRYQESVFWLGQITHDSGFAGTPVLFAWPSRGKAPLYVADRESVSYSRDYFEDFLREIAALPEVREIDILAHSMGTLLTVETLRQAAMKGDGTFGGKLNDVVLASPDIDVDVFRTHLEVIGPLPQPMTILVSGDDKALGLSKLLDGGNDRVGLLRANDLRVIEGARHYKVNVVDLTDLQDTGDTSNHNKFARSAAVMQAIGQHLDGKVSHGSDESSGIVAAVTNVGKSIVQLPITILTGQ